MRARLFLAVMLNSNMGLIIKQGLPGVSKRIGQEHPHSKTGKVNGETEKYCDARCEAVCTDVVKDKAFDQPDEKLHHNEHEHVLSKKENQGEPQQRLSDEICKHTGQQEWPKWFIL